MLLENALSEEVEPSPVPQINPKFTQRDYTAEKDKTVAACTGAILTSLTSKLKFLASPIRSMPGVLISRKVREAVYRDQPHQAIGLPRRKSYKAVMIAVEGPLSLGRNTICSSRKMMALMERISNSYSSLPFEHY